MLCYVNHFGWCVKLDYVFIFLPCLVLICHLSLIIHVSVFVFTAAFERLSPSNSLPLSRAVHTATIKLTPFLFLFLTLPVFFHSLSLSFSSSLPPFPAAFLPSFLSLLHPSLPPCSLPPSASLSHLSELWQVRNWMINDHQSTPPPTHTKTDTHFMLKWNCTYLCAHIFVPRHTQACTFVHYTRVFILSQ